MAYDLTGRALYPLSDLIDRDEFPLADFLPLELLDDIFDGLYYTDADAYLDGENLILDVRLVFENELALSPLGSDVFVLLFGAAGQGWTSIRTEIVLGPDFSLSFIDASLSLQVSENVLCKIDEHGERSGPAAINFECDITFSPSGIIIDNYTGASLESSYLCNTEIIIEASDVRPVFGPIDPPDFLADQEGFQGLAIEELEISLPERYLRTESSVDSQSRLTFLLNDTSIGSTGFTGKVSVAADALAHPVQGEFLGFPFRFREFHLEIIQNALVALSLCLDLRLEAFEQTPDEEKWVAIDFSFGTDGSISGALSVPTSSADGPADDGTIENALLQISYEDVLEFNFYSLRLVKHGDVWALYFSGALNLLLEGAEWPKIEFDEIGISSNKEFLLPDGAGIAFASPLVVDWHFIQLSVTKFRFGYADESGEKLQVALSAEILLMEGLPAGASVEGLTVQWTPGDSSSLDVSFDGIGIQFGIPGSFNATIAISYVETDEGIEFRGQGSLALTALDMSISIGVVIGRDRLHDFTYLYLFADAKVLPTGIPIGQTGLSIYGFQGLITYNMALAINQALAPDERFYELFTRKPLGITHVAKWEKQQGQNALGIGIVLGTLDKGFALNVKGMLVVAFPDLTILLQAKANFLTLKPDLTTAQEGALDALLVYASGQSTLSLDIVGRYAIPQVVLVEGKARAFFALNNSKAWFIEIGRDQDGKRVVAKALQWGGSWLFSAGFWFRLGNIEQNDHIVQGVITGFQISVSLRKSKGGFWIEVSGMARAQMQLYWEPDQVEGALLLSARIGAGYRGCSISTRISGEIQVSAPQPYRVYLRAEACVKALWWKKCKAFDFEWKHMRPPQLPSPIGSWSATPRHWTPLEFPLRIEAVHDHSTYADVIVTELPTDAAQFSLLSLRLPEAEYSIIECDPAQQVVRISKTDGRLPTAPGNAHIIVQTGIVTLSPNPSHGHIIPPHSVLSLDFAKPIRDETNKCFNEAVALDNHGYFTIGSRSGYSGAYQLNSVKLIRDPEHEREEWELWGTWARETLEPNTTLRLLSSERFGHDGSLTHSFLDGISIDYCEQPTETIRCVRLPNIIDREEDFELYGELADGSVYRFWRRIIINPEEDLNPEDLFPNRGQEQGLVLGPFDTLTLWLAVAIETIQIETFASSLSAVSAAPTYVEMAVSGNMIEIRGDDVGKGRRLSRLCYPQGYGSSSWNTATRRGGTITENEAWTVPPEMRILPPNETFELQVAYTKLLKASNRSDPEATSETTTVRFRTSGPPMYQGALQNYIDSVYPTDGSRPVYTGYDIVVTFRIDDDYSANEYVSYLYASAGATLMIRLFDGQGNPLRNEAGEILFMPVSAESPIKASVTELVWQEIYQQNLLSGCVDAQMFVEQGETTLRLALDTHHVQLQPNSQYRAQIVADTRPHVPLAEWSFTTSQYKTFTDLIARSGINDSVIFQPAHVAEVSSVTSSDFDALARALDLPTIAYVEQFTVMQVVDAQNPRRCIALLLESAEPLNFNTRLGVFVNGESAMLIPNADHTRGFAIPTTSAGWPEFVSMPVTLSWQRKSDTELPQLSINGSTEAEEVSFWIEW